MQILVKVIKLDMHFNKINHNSYSNLLKYRFKDYKDKVNLY